MEFKQDDGKLILIGYQRNQDKGISNGHGGITGTISCAFNSITVIMSELAGAMGATLNYKLVIFNSSFLPGHTWLIYGDIAS